MTGRVSWHSCQREPEQVWTGTQNQPNMAPELHRWGSC